MDDSFDKKHGMNTFNTNGKAFNGNIAPVIAAVIFLIAGIIGAIVAIATH